MIKIHGVIGTYIDAQGKEVKGIELVDVIAQVEAEKENQVHDFEINSIGGLVDVGYAIADYMIQLKESGKIVNTIGNGVVASIATIPFLEGQERSLVKGTDFLIHNPYVTNISGDSSLLDQFSKALKDEEKGMSKRYSIKTGIDSKTMDLLMNEDKPMNTERAVQLNLATKEIEGTLNSQFKNMQVIAAIKSDHTMDTKKFLQEGKKMLNDLKAIAAKISGNIKNLAVTTDAGVSLEIEGETIVVGALVTLDGQPTPSATYKLEDGSSFTTDEDGKISEVTPAEEAKADLNPADNTEAKLGDVVYDKDDKEKILAEAEMTLSNGNKIKTNAKGEIIAIEAGKTKELSEVEKENVELKATLEEMKTTQEEIKKQVIAMGRLNASNFKPEGRKVFVSASTHSTETKDETTANSIRENRKARKEKKES